MKSHNLAETTLFWHLSSLCDCTSLTHPDTKNLSTFRFLLASKSWHVCAHLWNRHQGLLIMIVLEFRAGRYRRHKQFSQSTVIEIYLASNFLHVGSVLLPSRGNNSSHIEIATESLQTTRKIQLLCHETVMCTAGYLLGQGDMSRFTVDTLFMGHS